MTLLQLRYFHSVCQYNSISKAAEAMHISQPAISIAVKELEEEFGVSLFTRDKKRLILTNEGSFFLERVSEILPQIDALSKLMSDLGRKQHTLNISLIPMGGSNLLLDSLHQFRSSYPDIQISITECSTSKGVENVLNGTCHTAFIIADRKKYDAVDGLILLRTQYVFCVSKSHPLAGLSECNLRELSNQSLILPQDETYLTRELKKRFYELGVTPKVLLQTMNFSLIRKIISAGKEGIFLTKESASLLPDTVQIPMTQPLSISYALVWKKKHTANQDLETLITLIRESFPDAEPY